MLKLTVK